MNTKFDELTKAMAQSVTRRPALKKLGLGFAGMALACFGLANKAEADAKGGRCTTDTDCNPNGGWLYICCDTHCVQSVSDKNCGACGRVCPQGTHCTANFGFPDCY